MRLSRDERMCSAMVSGVAEGFAARRLDLDQARDRADDALRRLDRQRRSAVLAHAAAQYVQADGPGTNFERLCLEFLEDFGADRDAARELWLSRFPAGAPGVHRI